VMECTDTTDQVDV